MSPSVFRENSLPNLAALTFCGVRMVSCRFAPWRSLSYWEVVTCPRSERVKKQHRKECLCHGVLMIVRKLCLVHEGKSDLAVNHIKAPATIGHYDCLAQI